MIALRRLALALPAAAALASACGEGEIDPGSASPTPTPSSSPAPTPTAQPTPSGAPAAVLLGSTDGGLAHAGEAALFRMKSAGAPTACAWVRVDDGSPFGFTLSSAGLLELGRTYDVIELVLGADGNVTWDAGVDHALSHAAVTVTTDLALRFSHDDLVAGGWVGGASELTPPAGFSWADGTGCPGDS